jgi:tetratricopeptide (TPR) repeat protein
MVATVLTCIGLERNAAFAESEETYKTLSNLYQAGKYDQVRKLGTRLASSRSSGSQDKLVGLYFLILLNRQQGLASAREFVERFETQNAVLTKETFPLFREIFLKAKEDGKYPPGQTFENTLHAYVDDRMPEAYYYIALNYHTKGQYADADLWFTRMMRVYQTDEMFIEFFSLNKIMIGSLDEAIELLTRQANLNPKNPRPVYNRAAVYARKGDVENSIQYLERAIKMSPDYRKKARLDTDFSKMLTDRRFIALTQE